MNSCRFLLVGVLWLCMACGGGSSSSDDPGNQGSEGAGSGGDGTRDGGARDADDAATPGPTPPEDAGAPDSGGDAGGPVEEDRYWQVLSAAGGYTCGIHGGRLYCWGRNDYGVLGDGTMNDRAEPTQVGDESDWELVAAGDRHTCGIRGGGLYCWGSFVLGDDSTARPTPTQVGSDTDWQVVAVGLGHTCAIRSGELYCWGNNSGGRVGDGSTMQRVEPTRIGSETDWTALALGYSHSCGIRSGLLFCWGGAPAVVTPTQVGGDGEWSKVASGIGYTTCGIRAGRLYCWGNNDVGQVGNGSTEHAPAPVEVGDGADWSDVDVGSAAACALRDGSLYCWGSNAHGVLGPDASSDNELVPFMADDNSDWEHITVSTGHVCGLRAGAKLHCRGGNAWGQLGDGTTVSRDDFTPVVDDDFAGEVCHAIDDVSDPEGVGNGTGWTCTQAPCASFSGSMLELERKVQPDACPWPSGDVKYSCCGIPGGMSVLVQMGCNTVNCENLMDWQATCRALGGTGREGPCS